MAFIEKPRCESRESEMRCDLDTRALMRASELGLLREPLVWLGVPERPVEADVGHVVAAELVDECNINDEVGVSADVGALDDQVTLAGLAILFLHGRDVAPFCRQASLVAEGFDRVEDSFVS